MRIGVIGAGMAGLAFADAVAAAGHEPVSFDKGRGPGGRMSTRRVNLDGAAFSFDHGAQYMTVRDPAFAAQTERWAAQGVVARWPAAGPDAWVGVPGMNAPVRALAAAQDVRWRARIDALRHEEGRWVLEGAPEPTGFDAVVVAVPAEQAAPLLAPHQSAFAAQATASRTAPCWTAMAAFTERVPFAQDIVRDRGAIGWAARNSAKPDRDGPEAWVIQADGNWSTEHLEETPEDVAPQLLPLLAVALGVALPPTSFLQAHRWRYARSQPGGPGALWDPVARMGVCGDWLAAPRVEAAWLSGRALADLVVSNAPR